MGWGSSYYRYDCVADDFGIRTYVSKDVKKVQQGQSTWGGRGGLSPPHFLIRAPKLEVVMKNTNTLCQMYSE